MRGVPMYMFHNEGRGCRVCERESVCVGGCECSCVCMYVCVCVYVIVYARGVFMYMLYNESARMQRKERRGSQPKNTIFQKKIPSSDRQRPILKRLVEASKEL